MKTKKVSIVLHLMEINERIIAGSEELFKRHGVRSVTMDDIAKHLGVSKKTIYQFFENKETLVNAVFETYLVKEEAIVNEISANAQDPVDEILKLSDHLKMSFQNVNPNLLFEIEKYFPAAWKTFQDHKNCCLIQTVKSSLTNGVEKGYFRKDMNLDLIAVMRMELVQLGFNPYIFPPDKFNMFEVQVQLLDHFLHGICTLKGHKLINKYKHIIEEE